MTLSCFRSLGKTVIISPESSLNAMQNQYIDSYLEIFNCSIPLLLLKFPQIDRDSYFYYITL
ncbi:hypothetical protein VCRLGP7_370052 [Vibrio crassostreae]|nr:hypothetical protein VCRLGP7_370052 [Vibrio crassostreae]